MLPRTYIIKPNQRRAQQVRGGIGIALVLSRCTSALQALELEQIKSNPFCAHARAPMPQKEPISVKDEIEGAMHTNSCDAINVCWLGGFASMRRPRNAPYSASKDCVATVYWILVDCYCCCCCCTRSLVCINSPSQCADHTRTSTIKSGASMLAQLSHSLATQVDQCVDAHAR